MMILSVLFASTLLVFGITFLLRKLALKKNLIDTPNARSSHKVPTPRGGGLAFVIVFLTLGALFCGLGYLHFWEVLAICGSGAAVAVMGYIDDHGHVPARWRLLAHFLAAAWGLFWLKGFPSLTVLGVELNLGWFGHLLALIYLVWLLNLYNFMDGIDGIASIEAISVAFGAVILFWLTDSIKEGLLASLLAFSVMGFLIWNFPPAKIFMGDAGSGFLGITIGLLSIHAAHIQPQLFWSWLILSGVFIVDATLTLLRRVLRGEKFYEAHRSHAYQYASRLYKAHKPVSIAVALINIFFLLPISAFVAIGILDGVIGVFIAYVPLLFLAIRFQAGNVQAQGELA